MDYETTSTQLLLLRSLYATNLPLCGLISNNCGFLTVTELCSVALGFMPSIVYPLGLEVKPSTCAIEHTIADGYIPHSAGSFAANPDAALPNPNTQFVMVTSCVGTSVLPSTYLYPEFKMTQSSPVL